MAEHFIQKMHMKKGAFSAKAKAAGISTHAYAEKERKAPGKVGKEARLALVFEGMHGGGKSDPTKGKAAAKHTGKTLQMG